MLSLPTRLCTEQNNNVAVITKEIVQHEGISGTLQRLLLAIEVAIPKELRSRNFINAHFYISQTLNEFEQAMLTDASLSTKVKIALEDFGEKIDKVLDEIEKDGDFTTYEASDLNKLFHEFSVLIEHMRIKNAKLKEMILGLVNNFAYDLLDTTMFSAKGLKQRLYRVAVKMRKQTAKALEYARKNKLETMKNFWKYGSWTIGSYLTYRMFMIEKRQEFQEAKGAVMSDIALVKGIASSKHPIQDFKDYLFSKKQVLQEVTFERIIGYEETKDYLKLQVINAKTDLSKLTPAILLYGPPGTGKTNMVSAYVNSAKHDAKVKYEGYAGPDIWPWHVAQMFDHARKNAPFIMVIDELEKMEKTAKNRLLTRMEGMSSDPKKKVQVIGIVNDIQKVSDALWSRFKKRIHVDLPNTEDRKELLKHFLKMSTTPRSLSDKNKILDDLANYTRGMSIRDIRGIVEESSLAPQITEKVLRKETLQVIQDKITKGFRHGSPELKAAQESGKKLQRLLGKEVKEITPIESTSVTPEETSPFDR